MDWFCPRCGAGPNTAVIKEKKDCVDRERAGAGERETQKKIMQGIVRPVQVSAGGYGGVCNSSSCRV